MVDSNEQRRVHPLLTWPPLLEQQQHDKPQQQQQQHASELWPLQDVYFPPPDTYPISYQARLLGFDMPLEQEEKPTFYHDKMLQKSTDDDIALQLPKEGIFASTKKQDDDSDDAVIQDCMDPMYESLLQDPAPKKLVSTDARMMQKCWNCTASAADDILALAIQYLSLIHI